MQHASHPAGCPGSSLEEPRSGDGRDRVTAQSRPDLRIGRVLKAHGVKGALRVALLTDFPDRFAPGRQIDIADRRLTVAQSEEQDGSLLVTFDGLDDRSTAERLVGPYSPLPPA